VEIRKDIDTYRSRRVIGLPHNLWAQGPAPMNTYRVASVAPTQWAVKWFADGASQGLAFGRFDSRAEALLNAFSLTRMEWHEARPSSA
jgi:hypothetical protein